LAGYLIAETIALVRGTAVPGRFFAVLSGTTVNLMAWILVSDISWSYIVVSIWHALQYLAYVHAFRQSPPPGMEPVKLGALHHAGIIFAGGLVIYLLIKELFLLVPVAAVAAHIGMNFHHYLADTLIWRKPSPDGLPTGEGNH